MTPWEAELVPALWGKLLDAVLILAGVVPDGGTDIESFMFHGGGT